VSTPWGCSRVLGQVADRQVPTTHADDPVTVLPPDLKSREAGNLPAVGTELIEHVVCRLLELATVLESQCLIFPPQFR